MIDWIFWLLLLVGFLVILITWPAHVDEDHESLEETIDRLFSPDPDDDFDGDRTLFWSRSLGFYWMPVDDDHLED